jgi:phage terminase small subunit
MSRPRKTNEELAKAGSRNIKVDQIHSGEMVLPELPPIYLSTEAKKHWAMIVPSLVAAGVAKEADKSILAMYCADLAAFHDNGTNDEGEPIVDEKARRQIGKRILDVAREFGLTTLSRQRSGINSKQKNTLIKQR